jgi:tRNA (guanine37-N1)-methyltransferase
VAALEVEILTLFPRMCAGYLAESILGKAQEAGIVDLRVTDIREVATGRHRVTDDAPYGGGAGMVMKPEPLTEAILAARARLTGARVLLTSPRGRRLDQALARELAAAGRLVVACGRYEGVDERVREQLADEVISVGDYVLSGGELPAMVLVDAMARLVPGAVGEPASIEHESFEADLLDHPHYTRPAEFRGLRVPEVLLSGHHARIETWRRHKALSRTRAVRPDVLQNPSPAGSPAGRS